MRSDLVFRAMTYVPNRFLLAKILAKASRGFHKPGTRIQDTTNVVLVRFGSANPIADQHSIQSSADGSLRHTRPKLAIRRKTRILTVTAARETSHVPSETFRAFGA